MSSGFYLWQDDYAVFYIDTPEGGRQYMSASWSEYKNENNSIVFVDSKKFLNLWKNDPQKQEHHLASGGKKEWMADYKYHYAEKGFSHGLKNPVPLAYPHCESNKHGVYACFTDGITRTIWLLSQGATSFPIEASNDAAQLFNKYAGVGKKVMPAYKYQHQQGLIQTKSFRITH